MNDAPEPTTQLEAEGVRLAYDERTVAEDLSVAIPPGQITVVVGPNACGKSTLLRALARLLKPKAGRVLLDGEDIFRRSTRDVATSLGILPQSPLAPEGLTVGDLVARGRYPHQRWYRQWSDDDEAAVSSALEVTRTVDLQDRVVDELSGGQRQRVWIAMALAQGTPIMLLDEPTTFLDIAHQIEVLDLLVQLNASEGRTIVLVLHDLNQACRYAHHLVAMREGSIVAEGDPAEIVTEELVRDVFDLPCIVVPDPVAGTPLIVPIGAQHPTPPMRTPQACPHNGSEASPRPAGLHVWVRRCQQCGELDIHAFSPDPTQLPDLGWQCAACGSRFWEPAQLWYPDRDD